jgi:hypothetical protein
MKQKVNILPQNQKGEISSIKGTVECCIPQGSILGPLLLITYRNDIPYDINPYAEPVIYVDDMSVVITANSLNDLQTKLFYIVFYKLCKSYGIPYHGLN